MPFTASHPALLYPLWKFEKRAFLWTLLIMGSIAPDMEYFIWMSSASYISHSKIGIIVFDLPVTFLLAFAWTSFMKDVLHQRIPFLIADITPEGERFSAQIKKHWIASLVAALIGILSHLVWDSFCHSGGFMVNRIPYLQENIVFLGREVRRCYIVWYISSIVGILVMTYWTIDFRKLGKKSNWSLFKSGYFFWVKVLVVGSIVAAIRIKMGLGWNIYRHLVIIAVGGLFYGLLISSFFEKRKLKLLI
jgi:hypothetical protein